jgi:hypothetical protein
MEVKRYFEDWWRDTHIGYLLKHKPCDGYWLLDTTACPLPVREVDADSNTRAFVHLPLFVYGEGLTDEPLLCKEGEDLGQIVDDITQDCRWQHLRLRAGSSEGSSCIARAAVLSLPFHIEIWDVKAYTTSASSEEDPWSYRAQGAGAAIVVSAVLQGMACALGVALGSLRTDRDIEALVDAYERLRGGQSVSLFSAVTTLAFYSKLGFRLERPQERFQAASKPYLYERKLPKALDSIAWYTGEPGWPGPQRRKPPPRPQRWSGHLPCKGFQEVERTDVERCLDNPGLLARHSVKWPLAVGIRARFRSGQATQEDCRLIEWVLDCVDFGLPDSQYSRPRRQPAGWLYQEYVERVAEFPGCSDYLEARDSGHYWTAAQLLKVQKELWAQGRQQVQELASDKLRYHPADEYCFAHGQRPAVKMVLNAQEFKNVVLARRPVNAITGDLASGADRLLQQRAYDDRKKQASMSGNSGKKGSAAINVDNRRQELWDHYSEQQLALPVSNGFELLAD